MKAAVAVVTFGAAMMVVALGCAPEKPSSGDTRQLQVSEGASESAEGQAVVARINGEELTLEEFERRIDGLAPFARVRLQSPERRREYLQSMVQFEVMADEAERRGYGDRPEVRHAMKETMVRLMIAEELRGTVGIDELDEAAVAAFYDEVREEFSRPERRRIAAVRVDDEAAATALFERWMEESSNGSVEDLDQRTREFQRFAFRHSQERETGDRGGDLGWVVAPGDDAEREVFEVEIGEARGPVEIEGRWEIWMVVEEEIAVDRLLQDVEGELRTRLYEERRRQARDAFVESLMADAEIEVFEDELSEMKPPSARVPRRLEELPRLPLRSHRP